MHRFASNRMSTFSPVAVSIPSAIVVAPDGMSDLESWRGAPRGTIAGAEAEAVAALAPVAAPAPDDVLPLATIGAPTDACAAPEPAIPGADRSNPRFACANNDDNCAAAPTNLESPLPRNASPASASSPRRSTTALRAARPRGNAPAS